MGGLQLIDFSWLLLSLSLVIAIVFLMRVLWLAFALYSLGF